MSKRITISDRADKILTVLKERSGRSASELIELLGFLYPGEDLLDLIDEAGALSGHPSREVVQQGISRQARLLITTAQRQMKDRKKRMGSGQLGAADERIAKAYDQLVAAKRDVTRGALRALAGTGATTVDGWLRRNHPEILSGNSES